MDTTQSHLRFVDAHQLDTSAGRLDNVVVIAPSQTPLGKLAGVVVDPMNRQLRYYVIRVRRWLSTRHYLMPLRSARLTADAHGMQVDFDAEELKTFEQVDPHKVPAFSEEDLLTTMFRPHAA
jgi:hypothetical protein